MSTTFSGSAKGFYIYPKIWLNFVATAKARSSIRHHLKHGLWDARNTVLFVGYQSPGTLGRVLLDGAETVRMMGLEIVVKAEILRIGSFSAHADRDDLVSWLEAFRERPKKVFLIHGEGKVQDGFAELLQKKGFNAVVPRRGNNVM